MEAHRATDNVQQKASDCLGTVNEWTFEPVFLGPRPNHLEASFTDPDLMAKIAEWKRSKTTVIFRNPYYYPNGGIITGPKNATINRGEVQTWKIDKAEFIINDNPKKD